MQNVTVKFFKTTPITQFWHCGKKGNCVKCKEYKWLDQHHVRTKGRGGDKTVGICRECHVWVGEHPAEASKLGLYIKGYGDIQPAQNDIDSVRGSLSGGRRRNQYDPKK